MAVVEAHDRRLADNSRYSPTGFAGHMAAHIDNLSGYANRPFPFVTRYLRQRLGAHLLILLAVVAAVACSVCTQYGVKYLVDALAAGPAHSGGVWLAFVFLIALIASDVLLWRVASWTRRPAP
jgi:ATP-binding cassette, subfamily B, bacterial